MTDKQPLRHIIKRAALAVAVFLLLVVGFCTFTDRPIGEPEPVADTVETGDLVGELEPDTIG